MGTTKLNIWNLALGHLGISTKIQSEIEDSKEAEACRRFYDQVLAEVLGDFPWPFAAKIEALAKVADDPVDEWGYSYRYPAGALRLRSIPNESSRIETSALRVPYRILGDATGGLIYTDQVDARIEYTSLITDPTRYPADFAQALSLYLARMIAPSVTSPDRGTAWGELLKLYLWRLATARSNALNEEQGDLAPDSEFIRARE